jgi:tRNA threonylcarbamoyladenosine dehydratase
VSVMAKRARQIFPEIEILEYEEWLTPENLSNLFEQCGAVSGVVDAIDSVGAKAALIDYCKRKSIPIITVGGAGGQIDPSLIQVADLTQTVHDPLASKVRQKLRQVYGFSKGGKNKFGVPCVYSTEHLLYPAENGIPCHIKPQGDQATRLDCASGFGAVTHVTCTFGMFASAWILNKLGKG